MSRDTETLRRPPPWYSSTRIFAAVSFNRETGACYARSVRVRNTARFLLIFSSSDQAMGAPFGPGSIRRCATYRAALRRIQGESYRLKDKRRAGLLKAPAAA